jgi:hypothetical protein
MDQNNSRPPPDDGDHSNPPHNNKYNENWKRVGQQWVPKTRAVVGDDSDDDDASAAAARQRKSKTTAAGNKKKKTPGQSLPPPPEGEYSLGPNGLLVPRRPNLPPGMEEDDDDDAAGEGGGAPLKRKASHSLASAGLYDEDEGDASLHPGALPPGPGATPAAPAAPAARLLLSASEQRLRDSRLIDARLRDPTRMLQQILSAEQVHERVTNGTLDPSKVRPVPCSERNRFVTEEPQAFVSMRAREWAETLKHAALMNPSTRAEAARKDLERMEVDYMEYLVRAGPGADRWSFVQQYPKFARRLEWNGGRLGQKQEMPRDEVERLRLEAQRLKRPQHGAETLRGKQRLAASVGFGGDAIERQRASIREARERASAGSAAASFSSSAQPRGEGGGYPTVAAEEEEVVEEEEAVNEETAGADAPRFFVYQLKKTANTPDELRAPPTRAEVEESLAQYKRVGPAQTWAQIVQDHARREDLESGRISPDVLPRALRHGGVVLLRQRTQDLYKSWKGYLSVYLDHWVDAAGDRARFVEATMERWRRARHEATRGESLYRGDEYNAAAGGFSNETEAEMRAEAHRSYDRHRDQMAAHEAVAPERARVAEYHQWRRDGEAAVREHYLAHGRVPSSSKKEDA